MPTAFDGQPDTVMILNGVFGAPAFIDGASFEQAINQQLQCGYSGNLLLRRNQNGAPMPLCVDTSTNLNGAAVEAIKMASMGTIWRSFMVQPDYESKVAVVFSDGKNEANLVPLSTVQATLAQNPDTKVYSVGLKGQELDTATLKTIGRDGAFWADSMADLQKAFGLVNQEIINMANSFYMFQYCTAKRSGSITFELGVLEQMRSPGGAAPAGVLTHQFTPTSAEYVCPL